MLLTLLKPYSLPTEPLATLKNWNPTDRQLSKFKTAARISILNSNPTDNMKLFLTSSRATALNIPGLHCRGERFLLTFWPFEWSFNLTPKIVTGPSYLSKSWRLGVFNLTIWPKAKGQP